jgi:hypothetical protein
MYCSLLAAPASAARKLLADRTELDDFFAAAQGEGRSLRLEKSWHGLHFLMTGTADEADAPLGFLLAGGEPVGDLDEADETDIPARLLAPEDVERWSAALEEITAAEFDRRFDPKKLAAEHVYPGIWTESREDLLSEYRMYFESLQQFVRSAAERGEAILVMIG